MEVKKIYIKPESCVVFNEDLCDVNVPIADSARGHHADAKEQTFDEYDFDELDKPMWDDYNN